MKNVQDLDLNLLKILKAVVETRNTHAAADKLGISQTSVSRGLAKLRESFGDQLFVRKAHGVEPSELAEKLAEAADEMFNPIVKVIEQYQEFDPQTYAGTITLAMHIYFLEIHGEAIFDKLRQQLPNAKFKLNYWQDNSLTEVLKGEIDYLIHLSGYPLPQDVYQHNLKQVKFGIVAKKDHPVLSQGSDWETMHSLPVARVAVDGLNTKRSPIEEIYLNKGYQANVVLVTHNVNVVINQLKHSDAILFGSAVVAAMDDELAFYPLPPLAAQYRQVQYFGGYLQSKRGLPLNQLLQHTIEEFFSALP
ncbi:LysR family transcriptional regulator [Shewanella sp. Scap07]|uniref:LysR family transcriptional regulator n=1 Tax=Shewanella sp. Scap07 TaxID=2589987 RepID=UPI0015B8E197|nr:LysR family transcriptional regulator [Shewanella sp. Scap07]QLE84494.1 LysR family transcriptional regulator [Shewanella sp. Scap07]